MFERTNETKPELIQSEDYHISVQCLRKVNYLVNDALIKWPFYYTIG